MNRRKFLKVCTVSASIGTGLDQLLMANTNHVKTNALKVRELNNVHLFNQLSRFRHLGDECLENFTEIISFTGDRTVSFLDSNPIYVPKVVVSDQGLKTAFDQQESIKGLDYIYDDLASPLDEEQIKKQFYFSDMIFLPVETEDIAKVDRMLSILEMVKNARTKTTIIAKLPFSCGDKHKHQISLQTINRIKALDVGYILIPSKIPGEHSHDKMKSAINNLVIQSVRAPTELVSYMGMPSGTPCNIDPILAMKGQATIGLGSSYGKDRAVEATMAALKSNSFNLIDLNKAQGVLVNITTGEDYTISEYVKVGNVINNFIDQELTETKDA